MSAGDDSHVHQLVMELTDPTKVRVPAAAAVCSATVSARRGGRALVAAASGTRPAAPAAVSRASPHPPCGGCAPAVGR